ncbi:MAG: hypothetical protein ACE5IA_05215 [Dehalococcoidia bacterium]
MAVIGSERRALRVVKLLGGKATKNQVADKMGVSPDYAEYLCKQMVLGGYLSQAGAAPVSRVYRLTPAGEEAASKTWDQPSTMPAA